MVDCQNASWTHVPRQGHDRFFRIGCMLHDTQAYYDVKRTRSYRSVQDIRLADNIILEPTAIGAIRLNCVRKIKRENLRSTLKKDFGKSTCTTACLQYAFVSNNTQ
jgi:hypothetical protein